MDIVEDGKKKLKSVKILLFVIAGLNIAFGIYYLAIASSFNDAIVSFIAAGGLLYFGLQKDIFILDYNPDIKKFAQEIEENYKSRNIYIYDIGDPAGRFYFGGFAKNLNVNDFEKASHVKGIVIVSERGVLEKVGVSGKAVKAENTNLEAVLVE